MAYVALYRSYRPKRFEEVIGQKHVIKTLKNAVMENKTSHAYIFSGLRGIGKTTIARILAKAVNCLNPENGEPCNECTNCLAINNNETTDIIELDAASNNGVDEMREILEKINYLPSSMSKKVYIIDEAHMLSTAAFNALLKTLEEPPHYVMFILATTEPHKIPSTILSRCQRFDFKQFTLAEIKEELEFVCQKESIDIEDEALNGIAEAAEGGMRDALSILDQSIVYASGKITQEVVDSVTGRVSNYKLIELIYNLKERNTNKCIEIVNDLINSGKETSRVVGSIIQFCRDILLYKSVYDGSIHKYIYENEKFIELASYVKNDELFYYIDILVDVQNKIRFSNTQKIYLEVGIMKIVNSVSEDIDILGKIQKLEELVQHTPKSEEYQSSDVDAKIITLDNKIKKITNEIEKAELEEFKEKMEAKIDMLEEVSSKNATLPTDITYRMDTLEDKIRLINANNTTKEALDLQEINNKIENLTLVLNSSNQENVPTDLVSKVKELEEKINNLEPVSSFDDTQLKERITTLEEYVELLSEENINVPSGNVSKEVDLAIASEINELKENYFVCIKALQELRGNTNNVEDLDDIYTDTSVSKLDELEEKLSDIYNKLTSYVEQFNNSVEKINNDVDGIKNNNSQNNSKIENINERINNVDSQIKELQQKDKVLEEEIKAVKTAKPVVREEEKAKPVVKAEPVKEVKKEEVYVAPVEDAKVVETNETNTLQTIKNVFDVRIIERILHEARDLECREEKARLINNWPKLEDKVGYVLASTAKMLRDGKLAANGKNEILIIYPNATICNHLMEPKNYNDAKQVLRITFGKDYDFMALPEAVWQEKRSEYIGQYGVGIKYPKLTPIKNPELKVVVVNYDKMSDKKKPIQQAKAFFGSALVEEESE